MPARVKTAATRGWRCAKYAGRRDTPVVLMRPAARRCNGALEERTAWLAPSACRSLEQVQWADMTTEGREL